MYDEKIDFYSFVCPNNEDSCFALCVQLRACMVRSIRVKKGHPLKGCPLYLREVDHN